MRKRKNRIEIVLNLIFLFLSIAFAVILCEKIVNGDVLQEVNIKLIVSALLAVLLVNLMKMLRLYIILFGNQIEIRDYLKQYFKTTVVNS